MFFGPLLLALAVSSSEAYRCCVPMLWEANEGMMMVNGNGSVQQHFSRVSFDGHNKMIAMMYLSAPNENMRVVQDFSQMIQYSIQGTECHKTNLSEPWDPYCIADNDTLLQDFYYGTPENRLDAQTFSTSKYGLSGYFTVTKKECVPIVMTLTGTVAEVYNFWIFGILNFTMGIQDSSIFTVPGTCMQTTTLDHGKPLGRVRRSFFEVY